MAYSANIRVVEDNIISLLKNKDQRGMELLYDRYGNIIYGFLFQVLKSDDLAEEALEEVYMRVWRSIDLYDPKKERLLTWVINLARQNTTSKLKMSQSNGRKASSEQANNSFHYNPESASIKATLENIDSEQKYILEGIYFMGYSYKYVSEKLNLPVNNLKNIVRETLRTIRDSKALVTKQ